MTTPPSTPDTTAGLSLDDAAAQREFITGLQDEVNRATAAVDAFQALGDEAAHKRVHTPNVTVAEHPAWEDVMERSPVPIDAAYVDRLVAEIRSAGNRAYVIAGHYRRIAANLQRALDRELKGVRDQPDSADVNAEYTVLAWAALDRLGYLRPHDEWTADGEPMDDQHQAAAHRLQRAGLLPEFGHHFAFACEA
ncbi:hypothetical protein SAMN04489727_1702 [Amycolatopsis tolypomycina]|uniref:Uncharacterized protein n=1 Tax=Amycolatopsis tolypomycina TaxID=208445 RepID=A0A1H4JAZ0_9PSEU|nr:hypothetical protein [Amycolatopsis tolypomycina]SEB43317.1 hypothetical protein SAMN04489727_1702 [Amycolatopsis tolypomycina]